MSQAKINMLQTFNDVARQVETPNERTIFVARKIFLFASVITLYNDGKQINAAIDVFLVLQPVNYCDMLHRVVPHSSGIL